MLDFLFEYYHFRPSKLRNWSPGVGLILALVILGPIGIIIGPFLGALLGEMSNNKSFNDSLKPAFGSFIGVIAGSVIKFLISLSFLFFYFDIFWGYRESFF